MSLGSPFLFKIVSENQFSGKTYFYTTASRVNSASDGLDTAANSTEVDDGPEADFSSGNKDACVLEVRINLRGHIFFGIPLRQLLVMVSWRNIRLLKNQLIR